MQPENHVSQTPINLSQDAPTPPGDAWPIVSVIIPARNAANHIRHCLDALMQQTYPRECFEVFVVDNGSTDETPQIVQQYPVSLLSNASKPSPYVARNEGMRHARGDVFVFLDSDCVPVAHWLESGIRALIEEHADLAGGRVSFLLSPERTASEMLDAISYINMKASIETRNACMTANLFVRRVVPETIGQFAEHVRSGDDIAWTALATRSGFRLVYSGETEVWKPARKFVPLLRKLYRTGVGVAYRWHYELQMGRWSKKAMLKSMIRGFLPNHLRDTKQRIMRRGTPDMLPKLPLIWLLSWIMRVTHNISRIQWWLWLLPRPHEHDKPRPK